MLLQPITIDISMLPDKLQLYLKDSAIFDSSCSQQAKTLFIDKDNGYFLKIAPKGSLEDEALMTEYFHKKGLSAKVCEYVNGDMDYIITEKISGKDGITQKYLDEPRKLCDIFSKSLRMLHDVDFSDCPRKERTNMMYQDAQRIYKSGKSDAWLLEYADVKNNDADEGYIIMQELMPLSCNDALLHGDYCLPNILLNDFMFSGFIDLGYGGIGDRHYDIFWGIWSLQYNLHNNDFKERFLDGYGRDKIDMDRLKLNGIISALMEVKE